MTFDKELNIFFVVIIYTVQFDAFYVSKKLICVRECKTHVTVLSINPSMPSDAYMRQ